MKSPERMILSSLAVEDRMFSGLKYKSSLISYSVRWSISVDDGGMLIFDLLDSESRKVFINSNK